jgi:hypothetical protein
MDITRSQGNMMWTNVTHHIHVTFLTLLIPLYNVFIIKNWSRTIIFSQHVETKKSYHDFFIFSIDFFVFEFFSIKRLKLFITSVHVYALYLCNTSMYIYTIYILTYTKICTQDFMEMHKSFNKQNISKLQ